MSRNLLRTSCYFCGAIREKQYAREHGKLVFHHFTDIPEVPYG